MGSGAYLAAKSEREIYHAEIAREREAIQMNGPEARELLSLYYQVKGLPEADATTWSTTSPAIPNRCCARSGQRTPRHLRRSALESHGLGHLRRALHRRRRHHSRSFRSSSCRGLPAVIAAAIVSLIAHFAVGAAKSLITVRSWWSSGLEMTVVGAVEGAVTYGIGILLGKGGM